MLASVDDLMLRCFLTRSIKAACHANSALPDAHDAISVQPLAPECFFVIFPTQRARDVASTTLQTPPSPTAVEIAEACIEPVAFKTQLPHPSTPAPSQDRMLIEAWAPSHKKITTHATLRPLTTTTPTPLKTYR